MAAHRLLVTALALATATTLGWAQAAPQRISLTHNGQEPAQDCELRSISRDGDWVSFRSDSSNLVPGDTNGVSDLFARNLLTNELRCLSTGSSGNPSNGASTFGGLTAAGNQIVFTSNATNIMSGATGTQVYVRDFATGVVTIVSRSNSGVLANSACILAVSPNVISDDGRYVVFESTANNLVTADTNNRSDVFVRDTLAGTTARASVGVGSAQSNGDSTNATISADGRYVAFQSGATNLVAGDTNAQPDVFVRDLLTNTTARASVSSSGAQGSGYRPALSGDGHFVAFASSVNTLVTGDTNADWDVFVRDLVNGTTVRASIPPGGGQFADGSDFPEISDDGRFVAFTTYRQVPGPSGGTMLARYAYVRDLAQGQTVALSADGSGALATPVCTLTSIAPPYYTCPATRAGISGDGRVAALDYRGSSLMPLDSESQRDVFAVPLYPHLTPVAVAHVGGTLQVSLDASGSVGFSYAIGVSTGYWPGIATDFRRVPIQPTQLLVNSVQNPPSSYVGFQGTLGASPVVQAQMPVPNVPALAGTTLCLCAVVLDDHAPSRLRAIANTVVIPIVP